MSNTPDCESTRVPYGPKSWDVATNELLRKFAFETRNGFPYAYAESALDELARRESERGAS